MTSDERSVLSIGGFGLGVLSLAFAGFALTKTSDAGGETVAVSAVQTVDVSLSEFAITPGMLHVGTGDVQIRISNTGNVVHNLSFAERGVTSRDLQPGESDTLTLKNVEAGEMSFLCTIPGHAASGMSGAMMAAEGGATDGGSTPTTMPMDWASMDAAMEARAMRFVEEDKTEFGGKLLEPTVLADGTKEFKLTAEIIDWEVEPGKVVKAWTYNAMVPGPEMRVDVGDKVRIVLTNKLPESTTIHLHGVRVPNAMDGVDPYTQDPIEPGATFAYEFEALEPAVGMYHSHHNAQIQVPNGLAGAFLIGEMPIPAALADVGITDVDQQVTMVLNDAGTIGLSLNGKSFPATQPYSMKLGDTMLVHYFNEGLTSHPMHLHQPMGWVIAKDGIPIKTPMAEDTINIAPGERYTVLYHAVDKGVWAWHCHILNHAEGPQGMFGMVTAIIVE